MQTNLLSTQSTSGINNGNAPARNASNGSDGSQFGAMLSNHMVERQAALPLPSASAPAPKAEAPKPQAADKPARHDDAPPAPSSSSTQTAKTDGADASQSADDADADADQAEDGAAAKADPAAEMLALMASLQQPGQDGAVAAKGKASAASQAFDALGGGKTRRSDAQLAALQAAMKSVSKENSSDAAGASGKIFSAASIKNPALAAAGADLGLDTGKAAAGDAADLRTALGAAGAAVKGEVKPQLDAADLVLRQARDAALQATAQSANAADSSPLAAALAQPAMLEAAEAAAAASESLSARVGTSQWENQVGQKVVYMVGSEEQTASLTLNPPDLGPLQVVLSVSNDQASVTFSANQEEVRQALENALPRLREMMSESGIALGNASVNAGMPDGRQAQDQQAQSSRGFGRPSGRGDSSVGGVDDTAARPVTRTVTLGDRGMVDTFA